MAWDRGRYYTRSKKVNGRVVREYIGTGVAADLIARLDAIDRQKREDAAADRRHHLSKLATLEGAVRAADRTVDLTVRAVLLAVGYRRHHRGDWRKRRDSSGIIG
jgi:hypothetical protein